MQQIALLLFIKKFSMDWAWYFIWSWKDFHKPKLSKKDDNPLQYAHSNNQLVLSKRRAKYVFSLLTQTNKQTKRNLKPPQKIFKHGLGYNMTRFLCSWFMAVYSCIWRHPVFQKHGDELIWTLLFYDCNNLEYFFAWLHPPLKRHIFRCGAERISICIPVKEKLVERMHRISFMIRIFQNFSWASYQHFWRKKSILQEGVCSITFQKQIIWKKS